MTRYEYDEEASERLQMNIVHEFDDRPTPVSRWVSAMRLLNSIDEPLARKILALHRDCGSGGGACDSMDEISVPMDDRREWGCETTAVVASHFGIEYPPTDSGDKARLDGDRTRRKEAERREELSSSVSVCPSSTQ